MDLDNWKPYRPQQLYELLEGRELLYWIAGGYALELYIGRRYRDHADLDIVVPRTAQRQVRQALPSYFFYAADPPGNLRNWCEEEDLSKPIDDVWVKEHAEGPFVFQIMFLETLEDRWIFKRNSQITGLVSEYGLKLPCGYRIISPQIQLLYKAKAVREKDELDFQICLPHLYEEQRQWLKATLEQVHPAHTWLNQIEQFDLVTTRAQS